MEAASPAPRRRRRLRALALSAAVLVLLALSAEGVFRACEGRLGLAPGWHDEVRRFAVDGVVEGYAPHPHTVFRRARSTSDINSAGFLDSEWTRERTPGVPRILCLGGSTTEGGNDLRALGSYPFFLEQILAQRAGRPVEVLNAGMSGWTSAEIVAAWFLDLQDYRPDLVIMHEAVNDAEPRNWPGFKADYSHWRHDWDLPRPGPVAGALVERSHLVAWLLLRGHTPTLVDATVTPPSGPHLFALGGFAPESVLPYRRNLLALVNGATDVGARFMFVTLPFDPAFEERDDLGSRHFRAAIREHDQVMRELAAERDLMLVDLEQEVRGAADRWRAHFIDLVHLQPEGNRMKAERIAEALLGEWLPALPEAVSAPPATVNAPTASRDAVDLSGGG